MEWGNPENVSFFCWLIQNLRGFFLNGTPVVQNCQVYTLSTHKCPPSFLLREMEWKKVLEWGQLFYNKQGFGQFSQPQRTKLLLQKWKYIKHMRDLLIIACLFSYMSPLTKFSYWQYLWTCNITDKMILNKDSYKGHPPGKKNTISAWRKYLVILQRRFENLGVLKSLR